MYDISHCSYTIKPTVRIQMKKYGDDEIVVRNYQQ